MSSSDPTHIHLAAAPGSALVLLISDDETGIHVTAFASERSAESAMRTALGEYSTLDATGMVPRYTEAEIEACINAGQTEGVLELPNTDSIWIEPVIVQP